MAQTTFTWPAASTPVTTLVRWGGQNKTEVAAACVGKHGVQFCGEAYCIVSTWTNPNAKPSVAIASVGQFIVLGTGDVLDRSTVNERYPGALPP
jgi:hypothetical protein